MLQNHRNLLHYLRIYIDGFQTSSADCMTTLFPFNVNGALHDMLLTLLTGGVLCPWNAKEAGFSGLDSVAALRTDDDSECGPHCIPAVRLDTRGPRSISGAPSDPALGRTVLPARFRRLPVPRAR